MSGIKKSGNRPKTAKHLRVGSDKKFSDTTKEDRERRHHETDTWAARQGEAYRAANPHDEPVEPEKKTRRQKMRAARLTKRAELTAKST